jgi:peptidyl-prolyl cis-trans isomerase SurA
MSFLSTKARGLAALLIVASSPALISNATAQELDSIVAMVEDDVLLRSELEGAVGNIRRQFRGREEQLPPQNVLERQVLERMVVAKLQVIRAEETGVEVTDTEIDQGMARVAENNQMTPQQLAQALAQDGVRLADFRRSMREEILTQKLRQRVGASRSDVSESEVDIALASSDSRKGEVQLAHVLVEVPDNASGEQLATAAKKIEGVKKLIDDGKMEFSAAAIRYSDDRNALEGGVIGWRRWDQIPPAFADKLKDLQADQVSDPVRSSSGLHILKILDTRENSQVMVEEFSARHIVINVDELTSEAQAERTIRGLVDSIKGGAKFADEAKKYSDDAQTAAIGGDLGWVELPTLGEQYAGVISALDDKGLSEPFRNEKGWVLIQRIGKRQQDRTEDYVRGQAREAIRQRKAEEAYQQFLRQLRNESFVEMRIEGAENTIKIEETDAEEAESADKADSKSSS